MTSHDPVITEILDEWESLDADTRHGKASSTDRVLVVIDTLGQAWTDYTADQIDSLSQTVAGMEEWGTVPETIAAWLISVLYRKE